MSLHHKHWLGFEDGIVGENADGTRAFAFEYERSDDSYPARGAGTVVNRVCRRARLVVVAAASASAGILDSS